jgi:serine/threonine protein kinase
MISLDTKPSPAMAPISSHTPEVLGDGGAGVVVASRDPTTGSFVAKKIFNNSHVAKAEAEVFKALSNKVPHMVQSIRSYLDQDLKKHCIDMRLIPAGNIFEAFLRSKCPRLEVAEIKSIAVQLFEFIDVLASKGYIHRDLKPDNLIWMEWSHLLTVIDFGAAQKVGSSESNKSMTTCSYAPPDLILGREVDLSFDLWSAGCIIYELITRSQFCKYNPDNVVLVYKEEDKDKQYQSDPYLYILQQIVEHIGPPSSDYFAQCKAGPRCFDEHMNLLKKWDIQKFSWKENVRSHLASQDVPDAEINQWIDLLTRLLSYENRGSAKEHLANPLFNSEVNLKLMYDTALKCKIFIVREEKFPQGTKFQDETMDVKIDLDIPEDARCIHFPRDPNGCYRLFLSMKKGKKTKMMAVNVQLKGHSSINISQLQVGLSKSMEMDQLKEDLNGIFAKLQKFMKKDDQVVLSYTEEKKTKLRNRIELLGSNIAHLEGDKQKYEELLQQINKRLEQQVQTGQ